MLWRWFMATADWPLGVKVLWSVAWVLLAVAWLSS